MATVKARRFYQTKSIGGGPAEIVRVTGFATVNGERWCRVRFQGRRVSTMLCHPNRLGADLGMDHAGRLG